MYENENFHMVKEKAFWVYLLSEASPCASNVVQINICVVTSLQRFKKQMILTPFRHIWCSKRCEKRFKKNVLSPQLHYSWILLRSSRKVSVRLKQGWSLTRKHFSYFKYCSSIGFSIGYIFYVQWKYIKLHNPDSLIFQILQPRSVCLHGILALFAFTR